MHPVSMGLDDVVQFVDPTLELGRERAVRAGKFVRPASVPTIRHGSIHERVYFRIKAADGFIQDLW